MSKSRLVLTVLIAFSLMIAAFGVAAPVRAQDGPVTLTITCRCVAGGVNNNLVVWLTTYVIPNFEQDMADQGRDVTVELIEFGGSDEQLKEQYALDLSVGSGYDLMAFDGFWVPEFVGAGLLQPLEEVVGPEVNEWEGWDHITPGIQAILSYQDEVYGLPMGTDVRQIFYRTDLFQQAGLEVPWQPTSWEELLDAARALKDAGVAIPIQINAGTPMGEATTMQGYFMALLGAGHHLFDFEQNKWIVSSPGILDTLNFYKTIYVDEELGDARMQLLQDGRNRSFLEFRDGNVGMLIEGDFFWRSVLAPGAETALENRNELVGWAMMPAKEPGAGFNGQDYVTISGGTGWLINPNSENAADAWALLSYMSGQDAVRAFELIQPRISFRDDVAVAGDAVMTDMAEALLPVTTVRPMLPEYPQISIETQLMTERVVSGEMSPEDAMQAFDDAVTELVGEENVVRLPLE